MTCTEGEAMKCVERYCDLAKETMEQSYKSLYSMLGRSTEQIASRRFAKLLASQCSDLKLDLHASAPSGLSARCSLLWS